MINIGTTAPKNPYFLAWNMARSVAESPEKIPPIVDLVGMPGDLVPTDDKRCYVRCQVMDAVKDSSLDCA